MDEFVGRIESLAYRGAGIARDDGKAVFVTGAVPGDTLRIRVLASRKRYAEGEILEILHPSPQRVDPLCPVFGRCGGCQWQHLAYEAQLEAKRDILVQTLARIGKIDAPEPTMVAAPKPFGYRRRVRFQAKDGMIGFYGAGGRELIEVESCPVLEAGINDRLPSIAKEAVGRGFTGQISLDLETSNVEWSASGSSSSFPFSQANALINEKLREFVVDSVLEVPSEGPVFDFFCGDGNLSLGLARRGLSVRGWDIAAEAIRRANTEAAGLRDAGYTRRSVAKMGPRDFTEFSSPRAIILDPPRRGLGAGGSFAADLGAERLLYVSCSPPDLARDIELLRSRGYALVRLYGLDMFPQTYHLEVLAVLDRQVSQSA
jgi:23S rRNA (uracil1939-C5)-methyltransferase